MTLFAPADEAELAELIGWAAAERQPLEITGGGSKRALGRPVQAEHRLDLRHFSGIVDYDPSELVLTAGAATPMAEIVAALEGSRQHLAFEPPDWSGLLGSEGAPTLGGTVACNLSGPRRVRAGAARDHFLGFSAVNGWGDPWRAGGRVVKNVTGYDLCKLQAGAYGTLSVLTSLSMKVVPAPPLATSLALDGLPADRAAAAMTEALNTPHEVSAAAWLPAAVAARAGVGDGQKAVTLLRLEGPEPSIAYRARALGGLFGTLRPVAADESAAAWRAIGAVEPLLGPLGKDGGGGRVVWRLCPTPSEAPALLARIGAELAAASPAFFLDWGGGLVWLSLDEAAAGEDCGAGALREALRSRGGGHATLVRAPDAARARVAVFEPQGSAALGGLTRRVKAGFDPAGVLNPGRMHEGL